MNTPFANQPRLRNLLTQNEFILGDTTIIGRHEDCNLVLSSERGASRKHARITIENHKAILMDLGSLNGTTVNGREISRAVQLVDGDILVFDEQEYEFKSPDTNSAGDNVTVIANKDEIGRPDRIKPAIRVVETGSGESAANSSFDDTEAWDAPAANHPEDTNNNQPSDSAIPELDQERAVPYTGNTAIPATSRPGGDAPTPKRLKDRLAGDKGASKRSLWFVLIPVLILVLLVAFYFAYTAGLSAGNNTTVQSP